MTTYRTRPGYFSDDPMGREREQQYREAFDSLPADIQNRLRDGREDALTADQIATIAKAPHSRVVGTYWLNRPEDAQWSVGNEFARWAEAQEPID